VKILNVVGARPNFMKMAPLLREMRRHPGLAPMLVHTGQHYDALMAAQYFRDLQLPVPDVSLEVGSGSHGWQTAEVMKRIEPVLEASRPDLVIVVGDVNSTMAAALAAVKLHIPVAHVEAGLRSFDRAMPEEINRVATDVVSDHLFVTEESGCQNLRREGIDAAKIHFVGNVMIDALEQHRPTWEQSTVVSRLGLTAGGYGVITLHRPSNVDDRALFEPLVRALATIGRQLPLVFPVHPRTRKMLEGLDEGSRSGITCIEPLGYIDFVALVSHARLVLTDSGGLQEETTALGVPCLTLREQTERPATVTHGTNQVIGTAPERIVAAAERILGGAVPKAVRPPLWDGHASERIVAFLQSNGLR
jgi:UDP-N-acetylglucosamine 2-epimerase (non-hydrolysing)